MAAIEGIFIGVVAVAAIAIMFAVMDLQYGIIDTTSILAEEQQNRVQEDVALGVDADGTLYLKNRAPMPVTIVEVRVLGEGGRMVRECPVGHVAVPGGGEMHLGAVELLNSSQIRVSPIGDALGGAVTDCLADIGR